MTMHNTSMVINRTQHSEYYTQRNNRVYPHESCMATSYAMACDYAGVLWPFRDGEQAEDRLMKFLRGRQARAYAKEHFGYLANEFPPNEIHGMLPWAYGEMGGGGIAEFDTEWDVRELVFLLLCGHGVVMSGRFPYKKNRTLHHVVCLAGIDTQQRGILQVSQVQDIVVAEIDVFIIDDPYGNYHTQYRDTRGNNVRVERDTFMHMMKPKGDKKWAHVISPAGRQVQRV